MTSVDVLETASVVGRSIFATAWVVVREPMFLLLLACGMIYLILGDVQETVTKYTYSLVTAAKEK